MKKILYFAVSLLLLPQIVFAATYKIDPTHTHIGFSVKHMVISNVKGNFKSFNGVFELNEKDEIQNASFNIKVESINTDIEKRDKHLRSADFFDIDRFPEMTFKYKKTTKHDGANYLIAGDFTMHGVTKEVIFDMELLGKVKDPWGNNRIGLTGKTKINRKDFGLVWNKILETGGVVVGEEIKITIEVEAIMEK